MRICLHVQRSKWPQSRTVNLWLLMLFKTRTSQDETLALFVASICKLWGFWSKPVCFLNMPQLQIDVNKVEGRWLKALMTLWALMFRWGLRRCGSHRFGKRFSFAVSCDGSLGNRRGLLFQSRLASQWGRKSHRSYKSNLETGILMSCSSTNRSNLGEVGCWQERALVEVRWACVQHMPCSRNVPKPWNNWGAIWFLWQSVSIKCCFFYGTTRQSIILRLGLAAQSLL